MIATVSDAEGAVTTYTYDANGNVLTETNGEKETNTYTYDVLNRVTSVTDANGNLTQKTDEDGYVTEYSDTSLDLVKDINYNGGKSVRYAYNKVGELVSMQDWNGETNFEVDLLRRITKVTDHQRKSASY